MGRYIATAQRLFDIRQKAAQAGAEGLLHRAFKQRRSSGVEDRDQLLVVNTQNGIERRVDDGRHAVFAQQQVLIALAQNRRALQQRVALGEQGALVDDGAAEVGQIVTGVLNAGNVQIAGESAFSAGKKLYFVDLCRAFLARTRKRHGHFIGVFRPYKRQQKVQRRVALQRLKQAQCHGVAGEYQAALVDHHQCQRHAGEQGGKTLRGALSLLLRVAQGLVLDFEFCLVLAQVLDHLRWRIAINDDVLGIRAAGQRAAHPADIEVRPGLPGQSAHQRRTT